MGSTLQWVTDFIAHSLETGLPVLLIRSSYQSSTDMPDPFQLPNTQILFSNCRQTAGSEGAPLLEDPFYPTLSWNVIHGSGTISQDIRRSSSYFVAALNSNSGVVQEGIRHPVGPMESQQTPFLSCKNDDLASWGTSYDGLSQDDEYNEGGLDFTAPQGRQVNDGEYNDNIRPLCTICFDAPRNCFFLPCGHCASCFECGTMIAEAVGTCPICRQPMKKWLFLLWSY